MNVSLKNIDATKGIVKLEIVKADYADKVEKSLRSFRQKAEMPGFRKGMVPMGMVKKMYGKHVGLHNRPLPFRPLQKNLCRYFPFP